MTHEVLARKWRPQTFNEVVGQDHVTETLINAINSGRLAHAYLFGGPRGVGKTSVARILAKALNCSQRNGANPCNKCTSCKEITEGYSVDVTEIDGASNRGIDEIRELRENIKYMPQSGLYRIYIIDEVHMLTLQAFNALLKTLEEPPQHVKFIFATTEPRKVPITILSRCQRFDFKRIPHSDVVSHLRKVTKDEGIEIGAHELSIIAREADGSMRDAQSLLDQVVASLGPKVTGKQILDILGVIDTGLMSETTEAIISGSQNRCLEIVEHIYNAGYDIKSFYSALMERFRNLLLIIIGAGETLMEMDEDDLETSTKLAKKAGLEKLQAILDLLIKREEDLRFTSHPRLVLETVLIRLCNLGKYLSFEQILRKIERLENLLVEGMPQSPREIAEVSQQPWSQTERGKHNWEGLIEFVKNKDRPMANILRQWHYMGIHGNTLKLGRGGEPFSSTYFDDPVKKEALEAYCKAYWQEDVTIELVADQETNPKHPTKEQPSNKKNIQEIDVSVPENVKKVVQAFEGNIISRDHIKGGTK